MSDGYDEDYDNEDYCIEDDGDEIEWIEEVSYITINGKGMHVGEESGRFYVENLFLLEDTSEYCGGILVTMKEATEANMREFVAFLAEKTPYSQLLCGDVTNKIFLSLGAIDLGGFLLLEVK